MQKKTDMDKLVVKLLDQQAEAELLQLVRKGKLEPARQIEDTRTGDKFALLPAAIERGWTGLALALMERGVDVNKFSGSSTPLMLACASRLDCSRIVDALLSRGADPNLLAKRIEDMGGETALMLAAEAGNLGAVTKLLGAGADVKRTTRKGQTAVYFALAIRKEEPERLKLVRKLVTAGCPFIGNELHCPVYERSVAKVELLLKLGCPVNERLGFNIPHGPRKGETPLTLAVRFAGPDTLTLGGDGFRNTLEDRLIIIKGLLAAGADPNFPDAKGWVPLMVVGNKQEPQISQLLLEAGADTALVDTKVVAKRIKRETNYENILNRGDKNRKEFDALWNR